MKKFCICVLKFNLCCYFLLNIVSCGSNDPLKNRINYLKNDPESITFAVVFPWDSSWKNFGHGASLATEQINAKGGVLNKQIQLRLYDDKGSSKKASEIAQKIINDPACLAVIGNPDAMVASLTAPNYRWGGLLFLTPSTDTNIATDNSPFLFRLNANESQLQSNLANFAAKEKYNKIVMYYENSGDGRNAANQFEKFASQYFIDVVDRRSYDPMTMLYRDTLSQWKKLYSFNTLMIFGRTKSIEEMMLYAREIGITEPIMSSSWLLEIHPIRSVNNTLDNIFFSSTYTSTATNQAYTHFRELYYQKYKEEPDYSAMMGYDSIFVLTHAINKSQTLQVDKLSNQLRNKPGYQGILNQYEYDENGDLLKPNLAIWEIIKGNFQQLNSGSKL